MKKIICLLALLGLALPSHAVTVSYTDGVSLPFPFKLDYPPGIVSILTTQTNAWPAGGVTNAGQIILTNVVIPVERGEAVAVVITIGANGTNAAPSAALYGDLSFDGGRTYTTTRPLSGTFSPSTNGPARHNFYFGYTNLAGAQLFRVTALSNSTASGLSGNLTLTNITLSTRKANPR